jgi:hypothetical protein
MTQGWNYYEYTTFNMVHLPMQLFRQPFPGCWILTSERREEIALARSNSVLCKLIGWLCTISHLFNLWFQPQLWWTALERYALLWGDSCFSSNMDGFKNPAPVPRVLWWSNVWWCGTRQLLLQPKGMGELTSHGSNTQQKGDGWGQMNASPFCPSGRQFWDRF